jgi:hypothetical protein
MSLLVNGQYDCAALLWVSELLPANILTQTNLFQIAKSDFGRPDKSYWRMKREGTMYSSNSGMSPLCYEPNSQPTALPRPVLNEERISAVNFSNSRPEPRSCGPQVARHMGQPNRGSRDQRTVPRDTGTAAARPAQRRAPRRHGQIAGTLTPRHDDRASPCPTHRTKARAGLLAWGQGHGAHNLIRLFHKADCTHYVMLTSWCGPVYLRSVHRPLCRRPLIRGAIFDQESCGLPELASRIAVLLQRPIQMAAGVLLILRFPRRGRRKG